MTVERCPKCSGSDVCVAGTQGKGLGDTLVCNRCHTRFADRAHARARRDFHVGRMYDWCLNTAKSKDQTDLIIRELNNAIDEDEKRLYGEVQRVRE